MTPGREPSAPASLEALVLAPVGRDAELIQTMLASARLGVARVNTPEELVRCIADEVQGTAPARIGVVVATDDALGIDWSSRIADLLERQPSWSDLPIVLLAHSIDAPRGHRWETSAGSAAEAERLMMRASVTVLDRPVRVATLVSAVRSGVRTRARQIEVRDLIEALKHSQQLAERAAAAKSDFLALMSHELRTPLNAIAGYAELLSIECYGPVPERQREVLGRITQAQRHLLGIINDVLNFAKLEKGRVEYDLEPVAVRDIIAEVTPLIEPQMSAKRLTYEVRAPAPEIVALADREKLRQILLNLLSNAVKFTMAGGLITVDVDEHAAEGGLPETISLRVSDTGTGIPADKLESVFEPFVQVRGDAPARADGTGLGLSISRDLARGMGGDLRVRSQLAKGSTFTIELPRPR